MPADAAHANNPPVYVIGRKRGTDVYRPQTGEHPDDETFPGLLLLRPEGRIFFANAARVGGAMRDGLTAALGKLSGVVEVRMVLA